LLQTGRRPGDSQKAELVAADKEFAAVEKEIKINWLK